MVRILITGSRDWDDVKVIRTALKMVRDQHRQDVTLVSGGCPTGADRICELLARDYGWTVESHPAEWRRLGVRAGFVRNRLMVKLGADSCVAFVKDGSRGATMTADLAERAGIPTVRYVQPHVEPHPDDHIESGEALT